MKKLIPLVVLLALVGCAQRLVQTDDLSEIKRVVKDNYDYNKRAEKRLYQLEQRADTEVEAKKKSDKQTEESLKTIAESLAALSLRFATMNCTPVPVERVR